MTKSATDLMQEILFSSLIDAVAALRGASRGVPNALLRDLNAIGPNTGFADLPKELQASLTASVRDAFNRLLREGYSVSPGRPGAAAQPPRAHPCPACLASGWGSPASGGRSAQPAAAPGRQISPCARAFSGPSALAEKTSRRYRAAILRAMLAEDGAERAAKPVL